MRPVVFLNLLRESPQRFLYILLLLFRMGKWKPGVNAITFVISVPRPKGVTTKLSGCYNIGVCLLENRDDLLFSFPHYLLLPIHAEVFGFSVLMFSISFIISSLTEKFFLS